MKTIFIPIFQGVEAKNILRTDIFKILVAQKKFKIVLIVSNNKKKMYFQKEFLADNIYYEIFDNFINPRFNRFFIFLKYVLIETKTMDAKRLLWLSEDKNYFKFYLRFILNRLFSFQKVRKFVRYLDWILIKDSNFKELFDKYNPDLVFLAHLFGEEEISMLRQARARRTRIVGLINSWDKLTSRCMIRLLPDKMVVHNNIMKAEATKHADMKEKNIEVVGIPHYDVYVNQKPSNKKYFFNKLGVDVNKKLLFFCPLGKHYSDVDIEVLNIISDFQLKKLISHNVQIVVRFPPNDIMDTDQILNKDKIIFYQPGKIFTLSGKRRVDWDMNGGEIQYCFRHIHFAL